MTFSFHFSELKTPAILIMREQKSARNVWSKCFCRHITKIWNEKQMFFLQFMCSHNAWKYYPSGFTCDTCFYEFVNEIRSRNLLAFCILHVQKPSMFRRLGTEKREQSHGQLKAQHLWESQFKILWCFIQGFDCRYCTIFIYFDKLSVVIVSLWGKCLVV